MKTEEAWEALALEKIFPFINYPFYKVLDLKNSEISIKQFCIFLILE